MIEFAKEIALQLRIQDNRATANPIYMVQQRKREYGYEEEYGEGIKWMHADEFFEVDCELAMWLEAEYQESYRVPGDYYRLSYRDHWEHVQPFFTEAAAQQYIDENKHNLTGRDGDPEHVRIYVESGYRNNEWAAIRKLLLALKTVPGPSNPDLAKQLNELEAKHGSTAHR